MRLSRRGLLRAGLAGTAATALGGLASGCAVPTGSTGRNMVLWYWDGGLGDTVLKNAKARYDSSVDLEAIKIGGYYRSKLITTMTGRAHIPDIAGLKGEDMASYLPNANQFVDLRTLGADRYRSQYLPWKWDQGIADDGTMVGFPIDCGPVAHYYQYGVYRKAGLPYEPDDVSRELNTWENLFAAGEQLKKRIPGTYLLSDVNAVFENVVQQGSKRYVDKDRHFIGDQEHVRHAWALAVEARQRKIVSDLVSGTPDQLSAIQAGKLPAQLNASWATSDLKNGVPKTKGRWRVAQMPVRSVQQRRLVPVDHQGVPGARAGLPDHHVDPERGQPGAGFRRRGPVPVHPRLVRPETAPHARPVLRRPDHDGCLRARRAADHGRLQQPVRHSARAAPQGRDQERRCPRQGPQEGLE